MLGVPAADEKQIFEWTNRSSAPATPSSAARSTRCIAAALGMYTYAQELGQDRLDHPRDDIASALMQAEVEGQRLRPQEFGSFFILLAVAGNETTRNAISWGMHQLTEHPDQLAAWQADFDAMTPDAIEEIVRWASPVIHMRRTANEDTEIGDQQIAAGDKVVHVVLVGQPRRAVFDHGHSFDITRQNAKEQEGYGAGGPHFCLGANLARREITLMFEELFQLAPRPRDHDRSPTACSRRSSTASSACGAVHAHEGAR